MGDPREHPPSMVDEFLQNLERAGYHVSQWSTQSRVFIDWGLENRQVEERTRRR